jgi:group I intron endonuclease
MDNTKKTAWIKSLRKRGFVPVVDILEHVSEVNWKVREKYWINFYKKAKGHQNVLNMTEGGDGVMDGRHHTAESILKMSQARKGYIESEKYTHPMLGKKHKQESIFKMSQSHIGQPAWNRGRSELFIGDRNGFYGKKHSNESKVKMSLSIELVKKIKQQLKDGVSNIEIAKNLGVGRNTVSRIKTRKIHAGVN